ncbi:BON domain-containing protein [Ferrovibrio sp.]|uniref:BON domain-containing protein n=1 Tax=Ferrovibrio sp. TaxID=1917215 RepID=UPI001B50C46F|nr:BON domain-containing protein [Ferrovibrio sp.]MBP7062790.1 BON domain-containing protein [Ferrovibrio sp.]
MTRIAAPQITHSRLHYVLPLLLLGTLPLLQGCVGIAVGAGAAAGVAAAEERGAKNAANDKGIQLAINERLFQKDLSLFGKVSVTVYEGRVLLTGVVQKQADRDEAERIAWEQGRAVEVINELVIAPSGNLIDSANDTWITSQLRFKLTGDSSVVDINYSIDTVNGTIYLLGLAQSEAELLRVTDHARTIQGVRRVVSHVLLKTDSRRRPV